MPCSCKSMARLNASWPFAHPALQILTGRGSMGNTSRASTLELLGVAEERSLLNGDPVQQPLQSSVATDGDGVEVRYRVSLRIAHFVANGAIDASAQGGIWAQADACWSSSATRSTTCSRVSGVDHVCTRRTARWMAVASC